MEKPTLVISLIALLISLGVPIADRTFGDVLTNELKDYYICDKTEMIKEFKGGVSGTQYSGYPFSGSTKGAVYCGTSLDKGKWIKLNDYSNNLGIDPYELLQKEEVIPKVVYKEYAKQWSCDSGGCKRIK